MRRKRKLILRSGYSPGDIVVLTAAVRDLHRCYPDRFLTDVRTPCPDLWLNNPYVHPLKEDGRGVEVLDCECPLINHSNVKPFHYLHGFIDFLNRRLDLRIQPTEFRGDIHLSDLEKSWYSQVAEVTGMEIPFWLVVAGGKADVPIKMWGVRRFQDVVDHFRNRIQFVQVGERGHFHPRLGGVIDLRGQTNLRELVRLVHHAQGVLCPVTGLMHLSAAVAGGPFTPPQRPCVVLAGGREPVHWEAYPHHQFHHTVGSLPCCATGGCWRDRTFPLGDGDPRDEPDRRCVDVVNGYPRCMELITPQRVIQSIETYFQGGVIGELTSPQSKAAGRGVRATRWNSYDEHPLSRSTARLAVEHALANVPDPPRGEARRGIVMVASDLRYFVNAWLSIQVLRRVGCGLPVELWGFEDGSFDSARKRLVRGLGVKVVSVNKRSRKRQWRYLDPRALKLYAALHSRFSHALVLDADNAVLRDPVELFESVEFKRTGAILWRKAGGQRPAGWVWDAVGAPVDPGEPLDCGQMVLDKRRCLRALRFALWIEERGDFWGKALKLGSDSVWLAFARVQQAFAEPRATMRAVSGVDVHFDFKRRRMFQHRRRSKWDLNGSNPVEPACRHEAWAHRALEAFREEWRRLGG